MTANLDFLKTEKFSTGYGNDIVNAKNYDDVLNQAGLNWTVEAFPHYTEINGTRIEIPNSSVIIRTADNKYLGTVSNKYKIVNNVDAFAFTESIYDSEDIEFVCGGSYRDGKSTWLEAKVTGTYSILGDDIECYLIFMNSHDGTGSVKTLIVPNRIACSNALNLPIKGGKTRSWRCRHSGDPMKKIEDARDVLLAGSSYMKDLMNEIELLQSIKIADRDVTNLINRLFPIDEKMTDAEKDVIEEKRDNLFSVFLYKEDLSDLGTTGYRFISAVADYADHVDAKNTQTAILNRKMLIAHGSKLVDAAYNMVLSYY